MKVKRVFHEREFCENDLKSLFANLTKKSIPDGFSDEQKWTVIERQVS